MSRSDRIALVFSLLAVLVTYLVTVHVFEGIPQKMAARADEGFAQANFPVCRALSHEGDSPPWVRMSRELVTYRSHKSHTQRKRTTIQKLQNHATVAKSRLLNFDGFMLCLLFGVKLEPLPTPGLEDAVPGAEWHPLAEDKDVASSGGWRGAVLAIWTFHNVEFAHECGERGRS